MTRRPDPLAEKTARLKALRLARDAQTSPRKPTTLRCFYLGPDDLMPFGKHQGKSVSDVIDEDPNYLIWAQENIKGFELTPEAETDLAVARDVRRPPRAWS